LPIFTQHGIGSAALGGANIDEDKTFSGVRIAAVPDGLWLAITTSGS
jgi:hypothetical protein